MRPPIGALARAWALLAGACLLPGPVLAAGEVSPLDMGGGQIEASAQSSYENALAAATSDEQWLAAARGYADLLRRGAAASGGAPRRAQLERAADLYREMLARSSGEERLLNSNNYATTLLELGRPEQATEALAAIEDAMTEASQARARPVYFFNYGQALEQAGREAEAARRYEQALVADARFTPASEALFRLAQSAENATAGIARATALLAPLIAQKAFAPAEQYMRRALRHQPWLESDAYPDLLTACVRYLTAAAVDPDAFAGWAEELAALAPTSARARAQVAKIREAYREDLPVMLDPQLARDHWDVSFEDVDRERGAKPTSSGFLAMIADGYAALDRLEQAFPRYVLAWNLDRENGDAALQMVNLLLEWPDRLDPTGAILDELILWLFEGKGDAYLGRDWEDILRFHVLLGTIFERRGQWGPPYDPRSALFQWEHALSAQQQLLAAGNADAAAVPGLHAKVAAAYQALGEEQQAWQHYADAAEGFVAGGNRLEASEALVEASRLQYDPTAEQKDRFGDLQQALGEVEERQNYDLDTRPRDLQFRAPELQ